MDITGSSARKECRAAIETAFAGTSVALALPFSGSPIGKAMGAIERGTGQ
jgi:hypothetical protein